MPGPAGPQGPQGPQGDSDTLTNHHQELQLSITPGEPLTFPVPNTHGQPLRMDFATPMVTIMDNHGNTSSKPMSGSTVCAVDYTNGLFSCTSGEDRLETYPDTGPGGNAVLSVALSGFNPNVVGYIQLYTSAAEITNAPITIFISMWW